MPIERPPRRSELLEEITTPGYVDRARGRAQRRKSPWNLLLGLFVLGGWVGWFVLLVWILASVGNRLAPDRALGVAGVFLSERGGLGQVLFFVGTMIGALPLALILANVLIWCIPPARRALDREAAGQWHASFAEAQRDLLLIASYVVPICLVLAAIGLALLHSAAGAGSTP
jgi:hypothetical protein